MLSSFVFLKKKNAVFKKSKKNNPQIVQRIIKNIFWFCLGGLIGFFFFISFLFLFYKKTYQNLIYSGVFVDETEFSGKTAKDVQNYFTQKNQYFNKNKIILIAPTTIATISAKQIGFGYDENLLAKQAYSIGRSESQISNFSILIQAYFSQIHLPAAYHFSDAMLESLLLPIKQETDIEPENALFSYENGKVSAFTLSHDGRRINETKLKEELKNKLIQAAKNNDTSQITINVPIEIVKPEITTENANSLGIKELISEGTSLFYHSIENRAYNISLAASKLQGVLIPPGEIFSFNKTLGNVSAFTGYKQAYVIENGRTVLGDGGGVCQVSTTLFRAALKAGLPIIERNPHAYRVGYYEQDSGPGVDAAVYSPSVDLKFKNDTGHHILIQSYADMTNMRLTFDLYGTSDGRNVELGQPIILSDIPAPAALYQDDPTLPKGEVKQVDFAANGANVYFTRTVKKDGKTILSDKFTSNYRPWQAIYLKGTKE